MSHRHCECISRLIIGPMTPCCAIMIQERQRQYIAVALVRALGMSLDEREISPDFGITKTKSLVECFDDSLL